MPWRFGFQACAGTDRPDPNVAKGVFRNTDESRRPAARGVDVPRRRVAATPQSNLEGTVTFDDRPGERSRVPNRRQGVEAHARQHRVVERVPQRGLILAAKRARLANVELDGSIVFDVAGEPVLEELGRPVVSPKHHHATVDLRPGGRH